MEFTQAFDKESFAEEEFSKKYEKILPNEKVEFEYTITPKGASAKPFAPLEYTYEDDSEITHRGTAVIGRPFKVESVAEFKERTSLHVIEWTLAVVLVAAAAGFPYLSIRKDIRKFNALKKKF